MLYYNLMGQNLSGYFINLNHYCLSVNYNMGLKTNSGSDMTYVTVTGGMFTVKAEPGTQGATTRVNKVGKTVTELKLPAFEGFLKDVKLEDGKFGQQWAFYFSDEGTKYKITAGAKSKFALTLLKCFPNIDLSRKLDISLSTKKVDGVDQLGVFLKHSGSNELVPYAFTETNPNGMPAKKEVMVDGAKITDSSERTAFFNEMVIAKFGAGPAAAPTQDQEEDGDEEPTDEELAKAYDDII